MSNSENHMRIVNGSNLSTSVVDEIVETEQGYARGPERALLGALLFDGIQAFINYSLAGSQVEKARFVEAFNWVMDTGAEEPFSFNGVCDALGVSPECLRLGLANASTSLLYEVSKSRRNF
jgi:hypothetical protein